MKDLIIYGAGGFGREVHLLAKQINSRQVEYNILGYVDDDPGLANALINGMPVLGNVEYLLKYQGTAYVALGFVHINKYKLVNSLKTNSNLIFPNLFHPDIFLDDTIVLGEGNILCGGMYLTCNIKIGNFNIFNLRACLGHDVTIGNFNMLGPNTFIAGEVSIGNFNIFAMNSSVLQQRIIGNYNTLNLSSVIIRNVGDHGVYFGVPALKQKF